MLSKAPGRSEVGRIRNLFWLAFILIGCARLSQTGTRPIGTPQIMCTAPACETNEVLVCPGDCPGGCGFVCATQAPASQGQQTGGPAVYLPLVRGGDQPGTAVNQAGAGQSGSTLQGQLTAGRVNEYFWMGQAGQQLVISVVAPSAPVFVAVFGPDNRLIAEQQSSFADSANAFETVTSIVFPDDGEYRVNLSLAGSGAPQTTYTVDFTITD